MTTILVILIIFTFLLASSYINTNDKSLDNTSLFIIFGLIGLFLLFIILN
jgi:hypothetical protein